MVVAEKNAFRFEELGAQRVFTSPELQERADGNPLTTDRKQFRVWLGEAEAAYLSFDINHPEGSMNNLYEICVARDFRNRGVGSECIRFAVELTKQLKKVRLVVRPKPFGPGAWSKTRLRKWYTDRGFKPMKGEYWKGLLEIVVSEEHST